MRKLNPHMKESLIVKLKSLVCIIAVIGIALTSIIGVIAVFNNLIFK